MIMKGWDDALKRNGVDLRFQIHRQQLSHMIHDPFHPFYRRVSGILSFCHYCTQMPSVVAHP